MRILSLVFVSVLFLGCLAHADDAADLGTILVEASRSNDTVGQMNKDVSIITSQDIADSPAKTLPDLLSSIPGVYGSINGNIQDQRLDIGGFGVTGVSNVLVLVDGRRLNTPDLAGIDLSLIDLNSVDHIEVIQGASTVLYGDNAGGGVINIVTKKGEANTKPSVTLSSEVDSYKGTKEGMDLSGGIPKLSYDLNYDRQQSDNYRAYDNYWANDYGTRLKYSPTDIFSVDLSAGYHLDRYHLPGGLTAAEIISNGPNSADVDNSSISTTSDSHFDVTPRMKFDAGTSSFDLSLFTSARKRQTSTDYPNGPYADAFSYETESYEFQPKLIVSTPLTDRLDNKLTGGYDYIYYKEDRNFTYPTNPEDTIFANEASQGVYLLDELTMDEHWLFNAGVRGAWADYVFNETQQTPTKFERSDTTEGYEGGLGYKYNPNSKVFVDYTRSYRLPNLDEFFQNPYEGTPASISSGLTYQEGNQYQVGIKDESFNNVHLGTSFTEAQYKNEIFYDTATYTNSNYDGRSRHYSQEGDASVDLLNKKVSPFINITFQQSKFVKGEYSNNTIPFVPDHLANAGVTFRPLSGLSTSFTTHFVGKEYLDGDEPNIDAKLKRYDTVDWNIKYDLKNLELWLTLQNIFDTRYITYGSGDPGYTPEYYPAVGRNLEAGVKVKF